MHRLEKFESELKIHRKVKPLSFEFLNIYVILELNSEFT